jgi:hypothetical protein
MCVYKLCLLLPFMMLHVTIYTCANAITYVRHMFNEIIILLVFKVDLVGWGSQIVNIATMNLSIKYIFEVINVYYINFKFI